MNYRRVLLAFVLPLWVAVVTYFALPWVAAFVRSERLKRYIKVETNYPGCIPGKESFEALRCECEFIFEGIRVPDEIRFESAGLDKSFDPGSRTYRVSGTGIISAGINRIVISSDGISINNTKLPPDRYSSFHVLIHSDGQLENSRIDIAW